MAIKIVMFYLLFSFLDVNVDTNPHGFYCNMYYFKHSNLYIFFKQIKNVNHWKKQNYY